MVINRRIEERRTQQAKIEEQGASVAEPPRRPPQRVEPTQAHVDQESASPAEREVPTPTTKEPPPSPIPANIERHIKDGKLNVTDALSAGVTPAELTAVGVTKAIIRQGAMGAGLSDAVLSELGIDPREITGGTVTTTKEVPSERQVTTQVPKVTSAPDVEKFAEDLKALGASNAKVKREVALLERVGIDNYVKQQRTFVVVTALKPGQVEVGPQKDVVDLAAFERELRQAGFSKDDVEVRIKLLKENGVDGYNRASRELHAAAKALKPGQVEVGPQKDVVDLAAFERELRQAGFSKDDVEVRIKLLKENGVDGYNQAFQELRAHADASTKGVEVGPQKDVVDLAAFERELRQAGFSKDDVEVRIKLLKENGVDGYNQAFQELQPLAAAQVKSDQEQEIRKLGVERDSEGYRLVKAIKDKVPPAKLRQYFTDEDVAQAELLAQIKAPTLEPVSSAAASSPWGADLMKKVEMQEVPPKAKVSATIDPISGQVFVIADGEVVQPTLPQFATLKEMALELVPFLWLRHRNELSTKTQLFNLAMDALIVLPLLKVAATGGKAVVIGGGKTLRGTDLVRVINTMERVAPIQAAETWIAGDLLAANTVVARSVERELVTLIAKRETMLKAKGEVATVLHETGQIEKIDTKIAAAQNALRQLPDAGMLLAKDIRLVKSPGQLTAGTLDSMIVALREINPTWRMLAGSDTTTRQLRVRLGNLYKAREELARIVPARSDVSVATRKALEASMDAKIKDTLGALNNSYQGLGQLLKEAGKTMQGYQGSNLQKMGTTLLKRDSRQAIVNADLDAAWFAADPGRITLALKDVRGGVTRTLGELRRTVKQELLRPIEGGAVSALPSKPNLLTFLRAADNLDRVALSAAQTQRVLADLQVIGTAVATKLGNELRSSVVSRVSDLGYDIDQMKELDLDTGYIEQTKEDFLEAITAYRILTPKPTQASRSEPRVSISKSPDASRSEPQVRPSSRGQIATEVVVTPDKGRTKRVSVPHPEIVTRTTTIPKTRIVRGIRTVTTDEPQPKTFPDAFTELKPRARTQTSTATEPAAPRPEPPPKPTDEPRIPGEPLPTKTPRSGPGVGIQPPPPRFQLPTGEKLPPGQFPRVVEIITGFTRKVIDLDTGVIRDYAMPKGQYSNPLRPSFRVITTDATKPKRRTFKMGVVALEVTGERVEVRSLRAKLRPTRLKARLRARMGR